MSERRSDEATQIINGVTGPQPQEERDGAARAQRARAVLEGYLDKPLSPEQQAEISAGVLLGHEVGSIVGDLVDGKSFISPEPQPKVTARGQATIRTPSQIMLGIVRVTGENLTEADRRDLETGRRTPGQIIEQTLARKETRVLPRVPGQNTRVPAHHTRRPVGAGRHVR